MHFMPPSAYLAMDYVGAAAHAAIFIVLRPNYSIERFIRSCPQASIISAGNFVIDTMSTLGHPQDIFLGTIVQLWSIFAQRIQNTHALAPKTTAFGASAMGPASLTGDLIAKGSKVAWLPILLGITSGFALLVMLTRSVLRFSYAYKVHIICQNHFAEDISYICKDEMLPLRTSTISLLRSSKRDCWITPTNDHDATPY
ncbi:Photosystem I P700 chlorophyll a apoprotein A1 [Nymphaea thermarum]|nr:Photosystem I P700 chlorophyll a apoprotein A1 [Nymphaea thermarum]